jgi:plastocyanin
MHRLLASVVFVGAALAVAGSRLDGAGTAISGTVTIAGLASSADVVVYVQQAPGTFPPKTAEMDQRKMQFIPHVLPVVAGSTVKFLNSDPTPHNVFSPDNEKYNLGTWPQGQTKDYVFGKCTKFPCVYTQLCRVHSEMEGYVVVLQNPYFAVTDKDGRYEIRDVPAGSYTLGTWHSKAKPQTKAVTVGPAKPAAVDFTLAR